MSGLETFENSEAWRRKLVNHLITARPPNNEKYSQVMSSNESSPSYDFSAEFQKMLKAKKAERMQREQLEQNEATPEAPEAPIGGTGICEFTVCEDEKQPLTEHDESFDAFERMCNKTSSDPDSTLFQYLNSEDKDHVLAMAKERSAINDVNNSDTTAHDAEIEALRRMLDEIKTQNQIENESPLKGVECTQLEDIEAPSRLWDTTLTNNESLEQQKVQISPVKMVGLLRPSTILEINEADMSNTSTQLSFKSALKTRCESSEAVSTTSCYETATDNSLGNASNERKETTVNVDDLFYAAIAKAKPHGVSKFEQLELLSEFHESLIDLASPKAQPTQLDDESKNESIIEVCSSSDEDSSNMQDLIDLNVKEEPVNDDKENESLHLNDTLEEIEYMMQKGLQYMAVASAPQEVADSSTLLVPSQLQKQNTFTMSPKTSKKITKPSTPVASPLRNVNKSADSAKKLGALPSRFEINMKTPNQKFFKTPSSIPLRRQKDIKEPYDHIISPIRTYVNKSGSTPLMQNFRKRSLDIFTMSSALEQESRACNFGKFQKNASSNQPKENVQLPGILPNARVLPKKAYLSADKKHVVDERTPLPMPNVPQIQKYLNSAAQPAVLRHDGKLKTPSSSFIPRPNQSLADLSIASGDISMYTIKDAQKF